MTQVTIGTEIDQIPEDDLAVMERSLRDSLLASTDWWASSDLTMTQEQIDYRQALRDITSQEGFPRNIAWPNKP